MNQKRKYGWIKHLDFVIVDLICIQAAYLLSYWYRHHNFFMYLRTDLYTHINILIIVLDLCYVMFHMAYKNILKRSVWKELESVIVQNVVIWVIAMAYLYVSKQAFWFSRTVFLTAFVMSIILMMIGRVLWKTVVRRKLNSGKTLSYILVITTQERAHKMIATFRNRRYNGFNLLGFCLVDGDDDEQTIDRVPVLCRCEDMLEYVKSQIVDEAMICLPSNFEGEKDMIQSLLKMGVTVHIGLDYDDQELPNRYVERIGGYTFLTTSISTAGSFPMFLKRLTDICAGLLGCAITGIAFIFVAPAIYKASPGPIFFAQERMGKNGRRFKMYKFRSMYMDAEERKKELMEQNKMQGMMFKMDNDPRIIGSEKGPGKGIGNLIRKMSIDELPQFYNILKGDMSLVGTRPPTVDEFEAYDLHHKVRLSMKPGLTGMWQVSGRSEITDFEEIVKLDEYYIENWSLKLDRKIIFKTFKVVLAREGAE